MKNWIIIKERQRKWLRTLSKLPKGTIQWIRKDAGLKFLSLILAVAVWYYVISSDATITRTKNIFNISGYVTGTPTLTNYGLALLTDPSSMIENVTLILDLSQADYAQANSGNVRVALDVSSIRTAGTQEVKLSASSTYGKVNSIKPETVTVTVETLDSRSVPVNAVLSGEDDDNYWYNITRTNPSQLTVSGAASAVQSIASALVTSDVSGTTSSYRRAEHYVFLDSDGNEVNMSMLNRSSSTVTVVADVYPKRAIPISREIYNLVSGRVADGYYVESVTVQPDTVMVAAEQSVLDGISELLIRPVSVDGLSQSFSTRAKISVLSDFKNVSLEEVYVNVTISNINEKSDTESDAES